MSRPGLKSPRGTKWCAVSVLASALVVAAPLAGRADAPAPAPSASPSASPSPEPPPSLEPSPSLVASPPLESSSPLPAPSPPAALAPLSLSLPSPSSSAEPRSHRTAVVVLGLAAASAVVGTIYGISALHEKRDFDRGDRTTSRVEGIEKSALLADMAFGAALTFGITGYVLWSAASGEPELASAAPPRARGRALTLAPWLSPTPGAAASLRF